MLVLVVDTSTPAIAAGVASVDAITVDATGAGGLGVTLLAEHTTVDGRAHGELLAPEIDAVLREASVRPAELVAIVAGIGPGPFTGLRVGLVTAATMAQALDIPAYGVCSLDGIGYGVAGNALVATDARRKEIYWARYAAGRRISEPAVGRPAEVAAMVVDATVAAGDGALRYAEVLGLPVREPQYPSLRALVELAADRVRTGAAGETLTPLYLRRPDAVEPTVRKAVSQ